MTELEQSVSGRKAMDFVIIVKALRVMVKKGEYPYDKIKKVLAVVQKHGDCNCQECGLLRKEMGTNFSRAVSRIAVIRKEYYEAERHGEFKEMIKLAQKGTELLFFFQRAGLDYIDLIRALLKVFRKKVIFI